MSVTVMPLTLRAMTEADIPHVVEIERASFPTTWPGTAYQRELERNSLAQYIVAVVEEDAAPPVVAPPPPGRWSRLLARFRVGGVAQRGSSERIAGYLGLWFILDEAHIVTVAVSPEQRGRGIGEALIAEAITIARRRESTMMTLECRVSNTTAQRLYDKYGFTRAGIRKRYYSDNGEDALIMTIPSLSDNGFLTRLAELERRRAHRGPPEMVEH